MLSEDIKVVKNMIDEHSLSVGKSAHRLANSDHSGFVSNFETMQLTHLGINPDDSKTGIDISKLSAGNYGGFYLDLEGNHKPDNEFRVLHKFTDPTNKYIQNYIHYLPSRPTVQVKTTSQGGIENPWMNLKGYVNLFNGELKTVGQTIELTSVPNLYAYTGIEITYFVFGNPYTTTVGIGVTKADFIPLSGSNLANTVDDITTGISEAHIKFVDDTHIILQSAYTVNLVPQQVTVSGQTINTTKMTKTPSTTEVVIRRIDAVRY